MLDTNVLMHDPTSLFRFEEHDVSLPMVTLEELDNNKKGISEVARNARQAAAPRQTGRPTAAAISAGFPLKRNGGGDANGRLFFLTHR